jgi:GTP-binding protein
MRVGGAEFVGSFPDYRQALKSTLPEIAFGGRSNVGKSSLINSLLYRKRLALISKTPGKTRLLNYYLIKGEKGKELLYFVDLPGYGYARVSAAERQSWKKLVEGYIEGSPNLCGFVLLIDSRRGLLDDEIELVEYLRMHKRKVCPVMTKSDKLSLQAATEAFRQTETALRPGGAAAAPPVMHSSQKNTGNEQIWRWIDERIKDARK